LFGNLLKGGTLDNLWDTHPPFQIDGNFGGTAGITEMLLQSHMGFIHLLPALPDAWSDGEVSGLLSRGNFEVKIDWREGKLYEARIISRSGEDCVVVYEGQKVSFGTRKGIEYVVFIEDGKLKFKK
jgi:alpha-L-fucosidase 2